MDLDVKESGLLCTLKPKGRLVSGQPVVDFQGAFMSALSSGHIFLIVDLESVPFVDSSGIGAIVNALRRFSKAGGGVMLVKPADFVSKTLKMVGVLDLFQIFESTEDATTACAGAS